MDDFTIDIDSTGFLDFAFTIEGTWDDVSMGIVEPTIGKPDDNYNPTIDAGLSLHKVPSRM